MQCLFSLLRIKGVYMFRAVYAHLQEAIRKRHLVYCVRVMSVGNDNSAKYNKKKLSVEHNTIY
jgi:hypothetical protein